MKKSEAFEQFKTHIAPNLMRSYTGNIDQGDASQHWDWFTDALHKNGEITRRQYETWKRPNLSGDWLRFTAVELEALPAVEPYRFGNIEVGGGCLNACDMKIRGETLRVLLSRITIADGAPYDNQISHFILDRNTGNWTEFKSYKG